MQRIPVEANSITKAEFLEQLYVNHVFHVPNRELLNAFLHTGLLLCEVEGALKYREYVCLALSSNMASSFPVITS